MVRVGSTVVIKTVGGSPGRVAIIILAIFTFTLIHRYFRLIYIGGGGFPSRHCHNMG